MNHSQSIAVAHAVAVPWSISTSVSNLHVTANEFNECRVQADSFWGNHKTSSQYRRIAIDFESFAGIYFAMFRSDEERGGREPIDWSGIDWQINDEAQLTQALVRHAALWHSSGECPNPHFYTLEGSKWATEYEGVKHFLICGCDGYVEVLAQGYQWQELGTLDLGPF